MCSAADRGRARQPRAQRQTGTGADPGGDSCRGRSGGGGLVDSGFFSEKAVGSGTKAERRGHRHDGLCGGGKDAPSQERGRFEKQPEPEPPGAQASVQEVMAIG